MLLFINVAKIKTGIKGSYKMALRVGSLFSGIGGMELGLEKSGMQIIWQVEQDANCQNVLKKHWSNTNLYSDVKEVGNGNLKAVDLICGGFPCQDLSVAGKRAGFDGSRSSLWFEFERIIGELLPRWIVIENVPGLLSSKQGEDFKVILSSLDELRYGISWRVLDSQNFGVAQRRRRVFIVGSLGNLRSAQVLFDTESLSRNNQESGTDRKDDSAGSVQADSGDGEQRQAVVAFQRSQLRTNNAMVMLDKAPTLKAYTNYGDTETTVWQMNHASEVYRGAWTAQNRLETYQKEVSPTLQARMGTGGNNVPLIGIRRLTPVECARLQGFPDDWNQYGADGKVIPDTHRYRQYGNAVTVNVAEWLGKRIVKADENWHLTN